MIELNYILPIASVLIGYLVVLLVRPNNQKRMKLLLAFSGGFLLAITILNLMPEVFDHTRSIKYMGFWMLLGIILQNVLEYFSKGAEHGHMHLSKDRETIPVLLFTSLAVHALLEGFPVAHNHGLLAGILVHKIPVSMILSTFLLQTKIQKPYIIVVLLLFALMTPLGSFIASNVSMVQGFYKEILALVTGIFLHISTTILFESNEGHRFNITKFIVTVLAMASAFLI